MNEIIDKIYRYIEQNNMLANCERVVVGLSGGADSVCLLMVLKGYIERRHLQTELCAVHVNHGMRSLPEPCVNAWVLNSWRII